MSFFSRIISSRWTGNLSRRWPYFVAAAVLVMGTAFSALLFALAYGWEHERIEQDFDRQSRDRVSALRKTIELNALEMLAVQSFYDGSDEVTRKEFEVFTAPLMAGHPSIRALQWAPRVLESQRAEFEQAAARDGLRGFQITERDEKRWLVPVSSRNEYVPIFFVEPARGNVIALGFDLATDPACLEAMELCRDSGKLTATSRILLPPDSGNPSGVRLFLPVYRRGATLETVEERRKSLAGFVVGVLRLEGVVEEALSALVPAGIDINLFDASEPKHATLMYSHRSRTRSPNTDANDANCSPKELDLRLSEELKIAGRGWRIVCSPSPIFLPMRATWAPQGIAATSLLLSALLAAYLVGIAAHNAKTLQLTVQLTETNWQLEREVVDRMLAEDSSHRENAKLSAMISGMEEGVVFADADNVIVEVNAYLCRFVGLPREQILGKRIQNMHQGPVLDHVLGEIDRFRNEACSCPLVMQRRIGTAEVVLRMQPIYRAGAYDGVLLNVIDVSELVAARQQAEVANVAKSRFLANMSHEIRTPLTSILGYTDLLTDHTLSASSRNNYLAVIQRNGQHLLELINDILDLSKIEAGKIELDVQPCKVVSLLADVASLLRPRAEQHGISLAVEYPSALPETILIDGHRLRQTLVNLVGNAVKFTERGSVRLAASFLPDWQGRPAVRFEVIDTGIGIPAEALPKLFQPFKQADATVSRKFGGSGLGLAISRHIAEMLDGELTAESVWGQGSRFVLTVPTGDLQGVAMLAHPAEVECEAPRSVTEEPAKRLAGLRILLAEDGFDNRELIQTVLQRAGAAVETAENGRIAVDLAAAQAFDAILMDMNMPEMDGCEATRLLRARGCAIPIFALTANAMADDAAQCMAAGCNAFLTKPIDRKRLLQTIETTCRKSADNGAETASETIGSSNGAAL